MTEQLNMFLSCFLYFLVKFVDPLLIAVCYGVHLRQFNFPENRNKIFRRKCDKSFCFKDGTLLCKYVCGCVGKLTICIYNADNA